MARRFNSGLVLFLYAVGIATLLVGCASTPMSQAMKGDNSALLALVRSGQVGPNEKFDNGYGAIATPFCMLVGSTNVTPSDIKLMTDKGADMNLPCLSALPLEHIAYRIFAMENSGKPEMATLLYDRGQYLIDRGATLQSGNSSMTALQVRVQQIAAEQNAMRQQSAAMIEENRRQAAKDNPLSAENLGSAIQLVAGTASAYTAAKYGATANNIASASTVGAKPSARAGSTLNSAQQAAANQATIPPPQNRAISPQCLPAGAIGDKADITPACSTNKNNTFGWGNTKAAACEAATRSVREEFDGKNPGGCYCQANAPVNSVVQPYVCWVMFD